ncbi:MAG: TrkH family potassium uptake protein [Alphaproteobacteria bacterium]
MPARSLALLGYAVRPRTVLKYFGFLCLSLAVMTAVPVGAALVLGEPWLALRYGVVTVAVGALGAALARIEAPNGIQVNEALVVTALTIGAGALATSFPLMAEEPRFLDALFESVSAVTTTGLSALATTAGKTHGFLFARAWTQWYGGLVIVVLALALVMAPGAAAKRLSGGEAEAEDVVAGTRVRARRVLGVYCGLTVAGVAVLWVSGAPIFEAVVHGLAAISTGGFSTTDTGPAEVAGWPFRAVLLLVCILGSINFTLLWRAARGRPSALFSDGEVRTLAAMCVLVSCLLALTMGLSGHRDWGKVAADAPFLAISAQTTTGFSTVPVQALDPGSKLVLILSMAVGGDMGSTAGGMKIFRLLVVLKLLQHLFARTALTRHAVVEVRVANRPLDAPEIELALIMVVLFVLLTVVSWLPFVIMGYDPLNALFEVVSALGTVGLSAGISGPDLAPALKAVLCLDMLAGRLDIVAFLVLFYPPTWFGRRAGGS